MAKLIVNPTSSSRREIALPRTLLSIGRDPSNDLVLPDAMVSRRHAVIEFRGNQYYVRDCNSSNGSLVNGDRVSERSLRDGDLVAIGTARLLFRDDVDVEDVGAKVVPHPSVPRLNCPGCSADYRKGDLFCRQCGTQLAPSVPPRVVCTACGTSVALPARFCNACGTPLSKDALESTRPRPVGEGDAPAVGSGADPVAEAHAPLHEAVAVEGGGVDEVRSPADEPVPPVEAPRPNRSSSAVEPAMPSAAPAPSSRPVFAPLLVAAPVAAGPVLAPAPERSWRPPSPPTRLEHAGREANRGARPAAEPAGFGRRLAAGVVDGAIVTLGQAVLLSPVVLYWWSQEIPRNPQDVPFAPILLSLLLVLLVLVLGGAYYVYFWGLRGATPGKQLMDLAVEGSDGAFPIGVPRAVGRLLGYYVLSWVTLGFGILMIAWGGEALHDRAAGTRVVRRERG